MTKGDMPQIIKKDEIDLVALFKTIWEGRKIGYYCLSACFFLGLVIAILSPVKYTASATLLPSIEENPSNLGGLSSLAGLAGVNIGSMVGNNIGITPNLYPQVVKSVPYLQELMHVNLSWEEYSDSLSLYDKLKIDNKPGLGSFLFKYTLGLPLTIKNLLIPKKRNDLGVSNCSIIDYYSFSEEDYQILKLVADLIIVDVDDKSGLVTLSVTTEEPLATAQLTSAAVKLLQKHVIEFKIQKAVDNLSFLQGRYNEAEKEYEKCQNMLFDYKDANRNIVYERMNADYQRMSDAFDIASTVYKGLSQQLEQAKITVKQQTPVFKILEPVIVPLEKSAPNRIFIIFLSSLIGILLGVLIVLVNYGYGKIKLG